MEKKYIKRLLIVAGLITLSSSFSVLCSQNIIHPKIACANDVWVNSYNGVLFYQRTDVSLTNRSMPLTATFYYNSSSADTNYGYGRGWTLGYEYRYRMHGDTITIIQGDGRSDDYILEDGSYKAPAGVFNKVTVNANGVAMVTPEGTRYGFGDTVSKRVTRITDRNNNYIGLTYTDGRISRIYDRMGRSLLLEYYADGLLSKLKVEGTSREWRYLYENGNLVSVTGPLGNTQYYGYNKDNRINRFTDAAGHSTWVTYNNDCQAHRIRTELSDMSIRYEKASRQTVIVHYLDDGNNQFTTYRWDTLGRVIEKTGNCCGYTSRMAYDENDNIISSEDANGNVTTYTYDNRGNMLTMTDPMGHTEHYTYSTDYNQPTSLTDKSGNLYTYSYDTAGNLTAINGPGGFWRHYEYNAFGQQTLITEPMGKQTRFTYDSYGNLATLTDALNNVYTFTYDLFGNLLTTTTPLGYTTTYTYDDENHITTISDPLLTRTTMQYDPTGRVTSITAGGITNRFDLDALRRATKLIGPLGDTTCYTYNAKDKLTAVKDALGNITRYCYDDRDRLVATINPLGDTTRYIYDALGQLTGVATVGGGYTEYVYDDLGQLIEASDQIGLVMRNSYDVLGRKTQMLSAKSREGDNYVFDTTSYTYDVRGRLIATHSPQATTLFAYDTLGRLTTVTDAAGHINAYTYDALGRVLTHTDPMGGITQMAYDADGRMTTVTDANGNSTQYMYDAIGRKSLITYPDNKTERFIYTPQKNRLENMTDMAGNRIWYRYDAADRLTAICYPTDTTHFSYDVLGRITDAQNAVSTVHNTYDAMGRLTSERTTLTIPNLPNVSNLTRYTYHDADRNKVITYPSGAIVKYQYDPRGRLYTVGYKESDAVTGYTTMATYAYTLDDRTETLTYGNGITTHYNRNAEGRLSSIIANAGGDLPGWNIVLQSQHLTYDPVGNILAKVDSVNLAMSHFYQYDNLSRLTQFNQGTPDNSGTQPLQNSNFEIQNYSYDPLGNRVSSQTTTQSGNQTVNYTVNPVNGYSAVGGQTMVYDDNGNLTNDGNHTYQYDYANRLVSVDQGNTATYRYDALGRRILKVTGGNDIIYYHYAGSQMIEADSTLYVYSPRTDDVIAASRGGSLYYYHKDHQGSTVAVSNGGGQAVESYSYDAFGMPTFYSTTSSELTASAIGNDILFTGREYDSETGLYYYRARTMNPATGRFLQQDPTGYDDGMNMYAYTHNNPVRYTDPSGLNGEDCSPKQKRPERKLRVKSKAEAGVCFGGGFCLEGELGFSIETVELPFFGETTIPLLYGKVGYGEMSGAGGGSYGDFKFETEEYDYTGRDLFFYKEDEYYKAEANAMVVQYTETGKKDFHLDNRGNEYYDGVDTKNGSRTLTLSIPNGPSVTLDIDKPGIEKIQAVSFGGGGSVGAYHGEMKTISIGF